MNTTAKALVAWIAVAIVLSARIAAGGPFGYMLDTWLAAAAVGQSAPTADAAGDKAQQTADLLRRARQAMAENNLAAADSLISQAETLGVQYSILHMGDTPKKARRDLDYKRSAAGTPLTKPSQMFAPLGLSKNKNAPTSDPFAGRSIAPPSGVADARSSAMLPSASGANPIRLPPTEIRNPVRSLSAEGPSPMQWPSTPPYRLTEPGENDARAPGKSLLPGNSGHVAGNHLLRDARLALAVGDVRRATELVGQAKGLQLRYQPLDDTPEKVEVAIRKYQELGSLDKNTEAYRRAHARNLMEQADNLLRWGERGEAERLASQAASMPIVYGPFEQKPQDLLQQIAGMPREGGVGQPAQHASPDNRSVLAISGSGPSIVARQQATELVRQAREAIAAGQFDRAEALARQAQQLRIPDSAFAPGEDRPGLVLLDLRQLRMRQPAGVMPAVQQPIRPTETASGLRQPQAGLLPVDSSLVIPAGGAMEADRHATRAVYEPNNDRTRNVAASSVQMADRNDQRLAQSGSSSSSSPMVLQAPPPEPAATDASKRPGPAAVPPPPGPNAAGANEKSAVELFKQGEAALKAHDAARAYELFRQAAAGMNELDPITARRLQDHLQMLSVPSRTKPTSPQSGQASSLAQETAARQQVLVRQVAAELAHKQSNARALRETDPKGALAMLEEARKKVESSGLDGLARDQLLRSVDRAIAEMKQIIEKNRPQLELAEKNQRIEQEVAREQRVKVEVDEKLARLIDDFNKLMDEQRYEEAQVVAKRAAELDPKNPVVVQVLWQAKFVRRFMNAKAIEEQAEQGFVDALAEVDRAKIPFAGDKNPLVFPDAKEWGKLSERRQKLLSERKRQRSEREVEIEKKLRTPVSLQFTNAPLSKVLENLAKLAGINLHLDPQGLAEEGVTSDTPVTIELRNEIMLKSALNLILEPLHLSYVIKDEVLKITSEQMRDGQVYKVVYNVADLVVPIPNFVPTPMGLQSAYDRAMAGVGFGGPMPFGSSTTTPLAVVASRDGKGNSAMLNSNLLAQVSTGPTTGPLSGMKNQPVGAGPGGLGGGAQADFDSLIDLITATVKPTTWDEVGGPGSIAPFETNLSIVVSQTQDVHEEIDDLLQQLRRLQDLQVTIEVRFITLSDNFFERIGISFDFDVASNVAGKGLAIQGSGGQAITTSSSKASSRASVVGLQTPTIYSADLDIPFTQDNYSLAVPQFGGFDATAGASLGFAILSDIEAYFFINAAQGDKRSNVLQAPKVTLFNGQQAYVSDTSQSPFVISVIPVVGDFAAAQQPVIVVLSEGTFMTVQAVVSDDKRFVRLTVVPYFSKIGEVDTFTFTGSTTTTTDTTREGIQSAATDPSKLWNKTVDNKDTTTTGTTVQLPTFSFVTVTTTVSVPDGGTVLLGGIKRLSEGRNEFGVPMLDKLPYLNRLFKNVGIGRETQSLMMMVTPRIIIQEEEEEKLGIQPQP